MRCSFFAAVLTSSALLVSSLPASAQVVRFDSNLTRSAAPAATPIQFRGHGGVRRFPGGGGFHRGGFGQRRFGGGGFRRGFAGGGYRHGGRGAAIGAGVAGLAAGALIGGALASQSNYGYGYGAPVYADPGYGYAPAPVPAGDATAYCSQRFKSYDPSSGTYLGYDGLRHPCP
jgi:hypothetical protein